MLVFHGLWAGGAACLWAEGLRASLGGAAPAGQAVRAPRPHPFAVDAAALAQALAELPQEPAGDLARKAVNDELTLWLPSVTDGPLASPS